MIGWLWKVSDIRNGHLNSYTVAEGDLPEFGEVIN